MRVKDSSRQNMEKTKLARAEKNINKASEQQGRSVLVLVDSCTAHPVAKGFLSSRLEFLPPNTTAILQPCDQEIICNLKYHDRLNISELDADDTKSDTDIAQSITTLGAIYLMFNAWANVSQNTTIFHCFRNAGFMSNNSAAPDGRVPLLDNEESFPTPVNMTSDLFNEFIHIDNQEPVTGELDDQAIIRSVKENKDGQTASNQPQVRRGR
ncbi:tigger transposable element-derived protein [Elysia marginata]|uniref:Tigger transposable element-derived protein n=1 Tax=Elysia marginata TaxID=1093978 RepID=A0AAV4HPJ5_9GAST|nr:tigger transposable element-derived protein [Elysia marginata]